MRIVQSFAVVACVCISYQATATADARSWNTAPLVSLLISLGRQLKLPGRHHRYFVRHTMLLRMDDVRQRWLSAFAGQRTYTTVSGGRRSQLSNTHIKSIYTLWWRGKELFKKRKKNILFVYDEYLILTFDISNELYMKLNTFDFTSLFVWYWLYIMLGYYVLGQRIGVFKGMGDNGGNRPLFPMHFLNRK